MNVLMKLTFLRQSLLGLLVFLGATLSFAQRQQSVNTQVLQYFPNAIFGSTPQTHDEFMGDLLNTSTPPQAWPAFPRTWLELSLDRTETTNTAWIFSIDAFKKTIPVLGAVVRVGGSAQFSTDYRYNVNTTFIAISSLRSIYPQAQENSKKSLGTLPTNSPPSSELRRIVRFDEAERRAYFNTSDEFPIVGVCKFEMTLKVAETKKNTIEFLVRQDSHESQEVYTTTYSVYSNFIRVNPELPIQEHLRTLCDQEFKHLVHYAADVEFNDVVKEVFAHYHPQSQCKLPDPKAAVNPSGDQSCGDWFQNPRYVMGSYRRDNVPRCVLGSKGIPICVLRAKENRVCPVYYSKGKLSEFPSMDGKSRRITPGDYSMYRCDKGLTCKPPKGELKDYTVNILTRLSGVSTTCQNP